MGQTGDAKTQENIRKELYLDQPKWKQFLLYVNDVSPIAIHTREDIDAKQLKGIFLGGKHKLIKIPYLRRSYQSKREVGAILMQALPGTIMLTIAAMAIAVVVGIPLGVIAAVKQNTWLDTGAIFSSIVGISAPSFLWGLLLLTFLALCLPNTPGCRLAGTGSILMR
ncbi:hypothetical protein KRR40_47335 [Niabella defluvii]|nr:hypothetical protein KRR40_47335 [Niabella sp. I65]